LAAEVKTVLNPHPYSQIVRDFREGRYLVNQPPPAKSLGQYKSCAELMTDAQICQIPVTELCRRKLLMTCWVACLALWAWLIERTIIRSDASIARKKRQRGVIAHGALSVIRAWRGNETTRSAQMYTKNGRWLLARIYNKECLNSKEFLDAYVADNNGFRSQVQVVTIEKVAQALDTLESDCGLTPAFTNLANAASDSTDENELESTASVSPRQVAHETIRRIIALVLKRTERLTEDQRQAVQERLLRLCVRPARRIARHK
jgi:hypothetical protein